MIAGIERFTIHDGPGIRTLVFMKGCPLRCLWCSSPHTQNVYHELLYDNRLCQNCRCCIAACPSDAIKAHPKDGIIINKDLCNPCDNCSRVCQGEALELVGRQFTPEQLLHEVIKDSHFYFRSQGGITIGGGEPTLQVKFVSQFLELCRKNFIHTAIETCGYVAQKELAEVISNVDLVYLDIKHLDDRQHMKLTGVSNRQILKNAHTIAEKRLTIIRLPVIPGYNDSLDNIRATAIFAAGLGENLQMVEILPYHRMGIHTYTRMGIDYKLKHVETPNMKELYYIKSIIEEYGILTTIGGSTY